MLVYAIIPARSGSKGIPDKNVRLLGGHPLIAWSIAVASLTKTIDKIFVSTDSEDYRKVVQNYGLEVPFLRPEDLAQDDSLDIDFLSHALCWFEQNLELPDAVVLLRPTTPLRDPDLLGKAIEKFKHRPDATSLCSGYELPESPAKNFKLNEDGTFSGFVNDDFLKLPRQKCPRAFAWDGYVDILRTEQISNHPTDLFGARRLAMITPPGVEIDTIEEFDYVEYIVKRNGHLLLSKLKSMVAE